MATLRVSPDRCNSEACRWCLDREAAPSWLNAEKEKPPRKVPGLPLELALEPPDPREVGIVRRKKHDLRPRMGLESSAHITLERADGRRLGGENHRRGPAW